jgi:hypothetical protein
VPDPGMLARPYTTVNAIGRLDVDEEIVVTAL